LKTLLVADAGPLIALAVAQALPQAASHFRLLVPQAVLTECLADAAAPGSQIIAQLNQSGHFQVVAHHLIEPLDLAYAQGLGSGEVAVLGYALQQGFTALIDERRARQVAKNLGIARVGSGAILLALKQQGQLPSIRAALDAWAAHGYYVSAGLRAELLRRADE
jgi:predicted nucleic acid-binding protein